MFRSGKMVQSNLKRESCQKSDEGTYGSVGSRKERKRVTVTGSTLRGVVGDRSLKVEGKRKCKWSCQELRITNRWCICETLCRLYVD